MFPPQALLAPKSFASCYAFNLSSPYANMFTAFIFPAVEFCSLEWRKKKIDKTNASMGKLEKNSLSDL